MNYKQIITIFAAGTAALVAYFFFTMNKAQNIIDKETLIVGTAAGYAPYVSINERGEYEGFDIDVIRTIAQQLKKKLIIKDFGSMTALMMALDQGSIDAIIWGVSITKERLQKYFMIHYQGTIIDSYPLIFWKAIPADMRTLDDMKGFTICVEPSSSQNAIVEQYPHITILPVEKVDDALLNIQYGKADAALLDPVIAQKFQKKFPEIKAVSIPLSLKDQSFGVGIVLRKINTTLAAQIEQIISALTNNGTLKSLALRWELE